MRVVGWSHEGEVERNGHVTCEAEVGFCAKMMVADDGRRKRRVKVKDQNITAGDVGEAGTIVGGIR